MSSSRDTKSNDSSAVLRFATRMLQKQRQSSQDPDPQIHDSFALREEHEHRDRRKRQSPTTVLHFKRCMCTGTKGRVPFCDKETTQATAGLHLTKRIRREPSERRHLQHHEMPIRTRPTAQNADASLISGAPKNSALLPRPANPKPLFCLTLEPVLVCLGKSALFFRPLPSTTISNLEMGFWKGKSSSSGLSPPSPGQDSNQDRNLP